MSGTIATVGMKTKQTSSSFPIAIVGPKSSVPCGIQDYVQKVYEVWKSNLVEGESVDFLSYQEALENVPLINYHKIFIHYEASLVPSETYLKELNCTYPQKVYVTPHEVYEEDPFAYPYPKIQSRFWPLLKWKQLRYKLKHKDYQKEKQLQSRGYDVYKTIPLCQVNWEALKKTGANNLLPVVPFASLPLTSRNEKFKKEARGLGNYFPEPPQFVLGLFGFLSPAIDYEIVFKALSQCPQEVGLLLIGGGKENGEKEKMKKKIKDLGLKNKVGMTGYVLSTELESFFDLCQAFVCPFKFKSNSSSLLRLSIYDKPLLTSDIPLTQELKGLGLALNFYKNASDIVTFCVKGLNGKLYQKKQNYPYSFKKVIEMYRLS